MITFTQIKSEMKKLTALLLLLSLTAAAQRNFLDEGNGLIGQKKNAEAEKVFREGLQADPANKTLKAQLAFSLVNQNKSAEAQQLIDELLTADPDDAAALW